MDRMWQRLDRGLEPGPEGWVELIGVGERTRWGELEVWGNEKLS